VKVAPCPVPQDGLLQRYVGEGATYTDCYEACVPGSVDLEQFVAAFYTTSLFRVERIVLRLALRKRIFDSDSAAMIAGETDTFAVWRVEARTDGQILLKDQSDLTRSWFSASVAQDGRSVVRFGSAVIAAPGASLPLAAKLSLPLHRIYSGALLRTAVRGLVRSRSEI